MDTVRARLRHGLSRATSRSFAAGVAARDSGARAGHRSRSGTERRRTSSPAGRHDAARLRVDASLRRAGAGRLRPAAPEHRLDRGVLESAQPAVCHPEMIEMPRLRTLAMTWLAAIAVLGVCATVSAQPKPTLKIGVTLHPYYSWTKNIVGDLPGYEVRSILPGEIDAGDYQPRPDDIKKLVDLDAIVVNGIGHDDFIMPMIKASGNKKIVIIRPNETTPQIHAVHGGSVNSHTFISFTNAIQQTYAIQRALAALRPQDAATLQKNAGDYARRLRLIKSKAGL